MNIKTITSTDGVNEVDFGSNASRFYWFKNLGATTVNVSANADITADADGTAELAAGDSVCIETLEGKVYVLGAGKVRIHNTGDKFCPFKIAPAVGGGVTGEGDTVVMDGLQGGVPFSEIAVGGKNLLPVMTEKTIGGLTYTPNTTDGTITVSGTQTAENYPYITATGGILLKSGKYTLSGGTELLQLTALDIAANTVIARAKSAPATFTASEDKYIRIYIYSAAANNGLDIDNVLYPQLEIGDTATDYEPPITGREITLNVCGKNLIGSNCETKSLNGIDFTVNADRSITLNGTSTAGTAYAIGSAKLTQGKKYRMSMAESPNGFNMHIGSDIRNQYDYTTASKTIIAQSDDNVVWLWVPNGTTIDNVTIYPQIENGDIATVYEPYHGSTVKITPDSNPYVVPNDIRQQDGHNVVSVSDGVLSVIGCKKNAALKRIWDKIDELTTAVIVSNGE